MSPHKRKTSSAPAPADLQAAFDDINDIIINIKPKLTDTRKAARSSLIEDLNHLAVLAQKFTEQRPRSNRTWIELGDALDREGVHLWNTSGLIRQGSDGDDRKLFAALRLAGFRLIEAGLEQKPSVETVIHVLQLASKAGAILSETGSNNVAASVLGCAAKFEELLRSSDGDEEGIHDQAKARAIILYYCCRMQAAYKEGNDAIAQFMLQKITESDENRLSLVSIHDREMLASKILEIGKAIMKNPSRPSVDTDGGVDAKKAFDAVKWIQKAFYLVEKMEDTATPGTSELKRTILRSLARAYFLSSAVDAENLIRAETTLQELIASINNSSDSAKPEHQELRWMRLAVLKRQKASDAALLEAFESIVDHTAFTEAGITDVLQELRTLTQQHALVANVLRRCLQRALDGATKYGGEVIERLLLSVFFHSAKDQNHNSAMENIEAACNSITKAEFELEKIASTACLTILWQFGDRHYQAKKWSQAADWFLAGTHSVFRSIAQSSEAKCLRKAALCYIEQREYARASNIIRRCPGDQATTCYVIFLTAAYQGLEDEAVRAIEDMVKASDFDRKMLLLATQLSHEADMKTLLLACLETLLRTLKLQSAPDTENEAVILIRCIIRLVLGLLKQPATDQTSLVDALIRHYHTAAELVKAALKGKGAAMIVKDVSWLWRTAYNTAVQGCSNWEHAEEQVADLFDAAYDLLDAHASIAVTNVGGEVYLHMVYASFAAVSGRVFAFRRSSGVGEDRDRRQMRILEDIQRTKTAIAAARKNQLAGEPDSDDFESFLHIVRVFQAELACQRRDWERVLVTINDIEPGGYTLKTFEAIADLVWVEEDCPVAVLYSVLEAILHAALDRGSLSVEKFSRWLRAICTILLSRNSQADRTKAISYVEQALNVLEDHHASESGPEVCWKEYCLPFVYALSPRRSPLCQTRITLSTNVSGFSARRTTRESSVSLLPIWTKQNVGSNRPLSFVALSPMARASPKRYRVPTGIS
ncbi:hypothetical protein BD410DRAFT_821261 [Rickenella mellea]|uniref:Protein ZIP4 homolog n=1 Tax=Rickenella mellea TaxID=50990 RepID=A0A4Y7Q431_9AGAM|nr:hypothetical protein BD410DRAFT_821261 [Rickenella mellea]